MDTQQQTETLHYFREYAADWRRKALSTAQAKVNVIQQRNGYVLRVIRERAVTETALDVGCGTGDLVCDVARQGIAATGVDFAAEMIEMAQRQAQHQALTQARFYCASIFAFDLSERRYDVVSANGFIEYISLAELEQFLSLTYHALNPGGALVVGSRNRLFNLFSLNPYTSTELDQGHLTLLMREAMALSSGPQLSELAQIETAPVQDINTQHGNTGIDVTTRYQFTPVQLMRLLQVKGFETRQIYPIHIHGVPPGFKQQYPQVHTEIANLLQAYADHQLPLVPYASSFMLHAQKGW